VIGARQLDDNVVESTFGAQPKVRFSASTGLDYGHRWALRGWLEETAAMYAAISEKVRCLGLGKWTGAPGFPARSDHVCRSARGRLPAVAHDVSYCVAALERIE
jgi:hypothetical protein